MPAEEYAILTSRGGARGRAPRSDSRREVDGTRPAAHNLPSHGGTYANVPRDLVRPFTPVRRRRHGADLALLLAVAGCSSQPAAKPLQPWEHEQVETLPMRPEWSKFVDDETRGVVLSQVNSPTLVRFDGAPKAVATRNVTRGETELLAVGMVDVPDVTGTKYRRPYSVLWRQARGGWELVDARVSPTGDVVVPPKSDTAAPLKPTMRPLPPPAAGGARRDTAGAVP